MVKKIGVLTYHHVLNEGAILQAYAQAKILQSFFNTDHVEIINYRMKIKEIEDLTSILSRYPLINLKRYIKCKKFVNQLPLSKDKLITNNYKQSVDFLKHKYDVIVVGSDEVWKISDGKFARPFPNIYWLNPEIKCKKIAIAASANKLDINNLTNSKIQMGKEFLDDFLIIGARDKQTINQLSKIGINKNKIRKVPDPTFTYKLNPKLDLSEKFIQNGIDINKPIVGMLFFTKDLITEQFGKKVYRYFSKKGYQIVRIGSNNSFVDYNLMGELNPIEWAHVFKYLDFCITDRFHGTVFSLKNEIPFLTIDHFNIYRSMRSKTYDLLDDFSLLNRHLNLQMDTNLDIDTILDEIIANHDSEIINKKLKEQEMKYLQFLSYIGNELDMGNDT